MKNVIKKALMGVLIFVTSAVQARVYCDAECTINYKDILSTLPGNATSSQREDFRADCSHRNGTLSGDGYSCFRTGTISSIVRGSGLDLYEARQSTRYECSQMSQNYPNASSSISNFHCE